jgi:hypothetical protein
VGRLQIANHPQDQNTCKRQLFDFIPFTTDESKMRENGATGQFDPPEENSTTSSEKQENDAVLHKSASNTTTMENVPNS